MRPARLYAAGAQCIATSLCFFLTAVIKLPVILYFPLSRRWSLTPNLSELSMDFYGRSLLALVGGAASALATLAGFWVHTKLRGAAAPNDADADAATAATTAAATAVTTDPRRETRLALLAGYVLTALLLAMGVYAYELYGRVPVPEPLPAGLSMRPLASPAVTPVSPVSPVSPLSEAPELP